MRGNKFVNLLMLLPVTGRTVGNVKNTVSMTAATTVPMLQAQPIASGTLNALFRGSTFLLLLRYISSAAGMAKDVICIMEKTPTRALKAAVEPRLMHPHRAIRPASRRSAATGMSPNLGDSLAKRVE